MELLDTVVRARSAITSRGSGAVSIGIRNGSIICIEDFDAELKSVSEIFVPDHLVLLPGLVDTHVHLQDPGNSHWENFKSGTRAAARGGITTLIDMPLDSIPVTVSLETLAAKQKAAEGALMVDVGFWAGVTPWNLNQLNQLDREGVFGFKCFLANTGLDEFPSISLDILKQALTVLKEFDALLLVHAEDEEQLSKVPLVSGRNYAEYLSVRPASIESRAVADVLENVRLTGGRAHIVHVSTSNAADLIQSAKKSGLKVTSETCPHYLILRDSEVGDGATLYKICPPIRDEENRNALWEYLGNGTIDMVVSDHSPTSIDEKAIKEGDFQAAFGGVASLQISFPLAWTQAKKQGVSLEQLSRWMSQAPAELARLDTKGSLEVGKDADFFLFDPEATFEVNAAKLEHQQKFSLYEGRRLNGVVEATWLRGVKVDYQSPRGQILKKLKK